MYTPTVGEHCYIRQFTGNYWVDMVKTPYTVIAVKGNVVTLQEAECIYYGPRYYDTFADDIIENPNGRTRQFRYSPKKDRWQETPLTSYPYVAIFGEGYKEQPYLN